MFFIRFRLLSRKKKKEPTVSPPEARGNAEHEERESGRGAAERGKINISNTSQLPYVKLPLKAPKFLDWKTHQLSSVTELVKVYMQ